MIRKLSPCRVIPIAAALLLLTGICYMLWPHSFAGLQPECDSITLIRSGDDTGVDHAAPITEETYSSDSQEFAQIMDILSRYTYHRSFRTLTDAHWMEGNHAGYWLDVYLNHGDDSVDFTCGGTGEILIDVVWRVGYWLYPLLELGLIFLLPGIVIGLFTQRCPFCGKFFRYFLLCRQKEILPLLRYRI